MTPRITCRKSFIPFILKWKSLGTEVSDDSVKFLQVYVVCAWSCVKSCMCTCVLLPVEGEGCPLVSLWCFPLDFLRNRVSPEILSSLIYWSTQFGRKSSASAGITDRDHTHTALMCFWKSQPRPHAWEVSTLSTEPSLQTLVLWSFKAVPKCYYCNPWNVFLKKVRHLEGFGKCKWKLLCEATSLYS